MTRQSTQSAIDRVLWVAGGSMATLMALAAIVYWSPGLSSRRGVCETLGWLLAIGSLAAYLGGYRSLRETPRASVRLIAGFGGLFILLALTIPPFHSNDVFCYVNIGWQQAHYGQNPYSGSLSDIPDWQTDPMFRPHWVHAPSAYGFLFTLLADIVAHVGGGRWALTVALFRGVNAVAFVLLAFAVWGCCRRLGVKHPDRALYLLLWNPLLIFTAINQGHNDIQMALFAVLAIYFALGREWPLVMPALMAATLVKFLTGPLLPLAFLVVLRRHGWTKALVSSALAIALATATIAPYVHDLGNFRVLSSLTGLSEMHNSLIATLGHLFEILARPIPALSPYHGPFVKALKLAAWTCFAVLYVRILWRRLSGDAPAATLLRDLVVIQFVLVCLVSSKSYPWYLGMFLPAALLLPPGDAWRRATLAVSCAQMLSLTFVNSAHVLNVLAMIVLPLVLSRSWTWSGFVRRTNPVPVATSTTSPAHTLSSWLTFSNFTRSTTSATRSPASACPSSSRTSCPRSSPRDE